MGVSPPNVLHWDVATSPTEFRFVDEILITTMENEVLIYDLAKHRAHCVTKLAYDVLCNCNGHRNAQTIAARLKTDRVLVERALADLAEAGLLIPPPKRARRVRTDRRRVLKQLALTAGLGVVAPVVLSIAAPSVAEAASAPVACIPPGLCKKESAGTCCGPGGQTAGTCEVVMGKTFCARGMGTCSSHTCR